MTEQTETLETHVKISDLETGQLVLTHGMRVRLGQRYEYPGDARGGRPGGLSVIAFDGVIENFDELPEDIQHYVRKTRDDDGNVITATWRVQSNDLAFWTRVVES